MVDKHVYKKIAAEKVVYAKSWRYIFWNTAFLIGMLNSIVREMIHSQISIHICRRGNEVKR